jgi:hypothetical protein
MHTGGVWEGIEGRAAAAFQAVRSFSIPFGIPVRGDQASEVHHPIPQPKLNN